MKYVLLTYGCAVIKLFSLIDLRGRMFRVLHTLQKNLKMHEKMAIYYVSRKWSGRFTGKRLKFLFSAGHFARKIKAILDQKHGGKSPSVSTVERWVREVK